MKPEQEYKQLDCQERQTIAARPPQVALPTNALCIDVGTAYRRLSWWLEMWAAKATY